MVVTSKEIRVDFSPGEWIGDAVAEAYALATLTKTKVKFKFNEIPMTIEPVCYTLATKYLEECNAEYNKKFDEREKKMEKRNKSGKGNERKKR